MHRTYAQMKSFWPDHGNITELDKLLEQVHLDELDRKEKKFLENDNRLAKFFSKFLFVINFLYSYITNLL